MSRLAIDIGAFSTVAAVRSPGGQIRRLTFDGAGRDGIAMGWSSAAAMGILRLVSDAVAAQGGPAGVEVLPRAGSARVDDLRIVCPLDTIEVRRPILAQAARALGLPDPWLVPGPFAAVYGHLARGAAVPPGGYVVVYDSDDLALTLLHHGPSGLRLVTAEPLPPYPRDGGRRLNELTGRLVPPGAPVAVLVLGGTGATTRAVVEMCHGAVEPGAVHFDPGGMLKAEGALSDACRPPPLTRPDGAHPPPPPLTRPDSTYPPPPPLARPDGAPRSRSTGYPPRWMVGGWICHWAAGRPPAIRPRYRCSCR